MTVNCFVNDMLARMRNAITRRLLTVKVLKSKYCISILKLLVSRGVVRYLDASDKYLVEVGLKYVGNRSVVREIQQVSTPSRRHNVTVKKLRTKFPSGSFVVVSTKKGMMLREQALSMNIGGTVVCIIYF